MSELEKYEEQFAHRFSEKDEEFQKYVLHPAAEPPIVESWRSRDNRYQDRPQWGRGGGWGQRPHDRRHGGSYNSYNQRAHRDRY